MSKAAFKKIGPYRLVKLVHDGEASQVWKAYDDGAQQPVGIKTLTEKYRRSREHIGLLKREYAVGAKLVHPCILRIHQLGNDRGLPYLVMEWIEGPTVEAFFADRSVPPEKKEAVVARFVPVLARRHARARALCEPSLLYENPTFNHVFISGERLVHHDFEIVFQGRRALAPLVRREIVGFLGSMAKAAPQAFPRLLRVFADRYPDREALRHTAEELARYGGIPLFSWVGPLTMLFQRSGRRRKRASVAAALARVLEEGVSGAGR